MPSHYPTAAAVLARSGELLEEGQDEANTALMRAAIDWFPEDADIRLRAGVLAAAAGDLEEGKELLRGAVDLARDDPDVLTRAASQMRVLGEEDHAERWTRKAVKLAPDDFDRAGHLSYLLGMVMIRHGLEDQAQEMFTQSFDADPGMAVHGITLASFLEARGDREGALVVAEAALGHSPGDPDLEFIRERLVKRGEDE
jgi:tetratricopeptide (TPR) repeat protein